MVRQATTDLRQSAVSTVGEGRLFALLVALPCIFGLLGPANARPARIAIVVVSDGAPFTIIRGTELMSGGNGVALYSGDMLESGSDSLVVAELSDEATIAFGPSTQAYLQERTDGPTIVLLRGWIKTDVLGTDHSKPCQVLASRLGAATSAGVFVVHAGAHEDEVFNEFGEATLMLINGGGLRAERESKANQFMVRTERGAVSAQSRPSEPFLQAMPVTFRDALPEARSKSPTFKTAEAAPLRAVSYDDVASWLAMPRQWRGGFTARFRGRLNDPAFREALSAHVAQHPEWAEILDATSDTNGTDHANVSDIQRNNRPN
jgi:hypothetical protein